MTCSGTRAAELALRLKYAGVDPERLHVADEPRARRSTPRWPTASGPLSRCRPTPRCSRCASCSSRAARPGASCAMSRRRSSSGTTSSAAATPPTCRCGASWPARPAGRSSTSAPGPGRVALDLPRGATRSTALDLDPSCSPPCAERATRGRRRRRDRRRRRAATSTSPRRASGWSLVPMQTIQLLGGERARLLRRAPALARAGRRASPSRSPTALEASTATPRCPCPTSHARRLRRYVSQPSRSACDGDRVRDRARSADGRADGERATSTTSSASRSSRRGGSRPRPPPAGLEARRAARHPPDPEHVGSEVVVLRG